MYNIYMKRAAIIFLCFSVFSFSLFAQDSEPQQRSQKELDDELRRAISRSNVDSVSELLEAGANPNGFYIEQANITFLMDAVDEDNIQVVQLLLEYGADLQAISTAGRNVAFYAKSIEMLEFLAGLEVRFDLINNEGRSPMGQSVYDSSPAAALYILAWEEMHSPDFSGSFDNRNEYLTNIFSVYISRSSSSREGDMLLIETLLDSGADPAGKFENNIPFVNRFTFLGDQRSQRIVSMLIERGAPVDGFNSYDKTLLMEAADDRANSLLDFLLLHGADPNQQNSSGKTALMFAQSEQTVLALLAKGAEINLYDNKGETALMLAWLSNSIPVQKALIQNGADPTIKDNNNNTVLHRWYFSADVSLLDDFLSRGCDINETNNQGRTPLMNAARSASNYAILKLLERGADPNILDNRGSSVIYQYVRNVNWRQLEEGEKPEEVVSALLAAGARPADTDEDGNSALRYVLNKKNRSFTGKGSEPSRDLILSHSNSEEKKIAKATIKEERSGHFAAEVLPVIGRMAIPLALTGLSIWMREGIYAGNEADNPMGIVSSALGFGYAGFTLGFLALLPAARAGTSGDWSDMFAGLLPLASGLLVGTIGLVGGSILAIAQPAVRRAFSENPFLYYTPLALTAGITFMWSLGW